MEKIKVTPWKGEKYELVDHVSSLIEMDDKFLYLDMNFKFEFEEEDEMGIKKPTRSSTNFITKLRRKDIFIEVGHDHHHEDRLCENDLPVVIIRSVYNFSFWLYLEEEEASVLYSRITSWIDEN